MKFDGSVEGSRKSFTETRTRFDKVRKTEPWWVCSCGSKIARPGKGLQVAFRKHREETGCNGGGGIVQVEQRKEKAK